MIIPITIVTIDSETIKLKQDLRCRNYGEKL